MMKKKLAMLLALVMTVTSIEGSALAVRGADFGAEPVQIAEEAEPQAAAEEASAENFGSETSEESFSDEFTAEEAPEIEAGAEGAEEIFGSEETESAPESGEEETEPQDVTEGDIFQAEENVIGEEIPQEEAVLGDEVQAVEEDFAAGAGTMIPQEDVIPLELNQDYIVEIDLAEKEIWYSFTPKETGIYSFSSVSDDTAPDPYCSLYDEEETYLAGDDDNAHTDYNDFRLGYRLQADTTYYYCVQAYDIGTFNVRLEQEDVEITPLILNQDYRVNIDSSVREAVFSFVPQESGQYVFSSSNVNGSVECSLYNDQEELLAEKSGNFEMNYILQAAQKYYYCITSVYGGSCNVQLEKYIVDETVLDESGKTSVENQGNTLALKFSAKEEGMYQFRFNVPISSTEIHTEQGEIINLSRDAYRHFQYLKKGNHTIFCKVDERYPILTAETEFMEKPTAIRARVLKPVCTVGDTLYDYVDLEATIGGKIYKLRKGNGINGWDIDYRLEQNGVEINEYNLSVGTYTITPYLVTNGLPENINEGIEITSATVEYVLPDYEKLPILNLDEWIEADQSVTVYGKYLFTAPKAGKYSYRIESEPIFGGIAGGALYFYKKDQDGSLQKSSEIILDKNESCYVDLNVSSKAKVKVVLDGEMISGRQINLQPGMDVFVNQTEPSVNAIFTPKESGYYELNLEFEEGSDCPDIIIDGESYYENHRKYLEKGKQYQYELRFDEEFFEGYGIYHLSFNKEDIREIQDISLVPRKNVDISELCAGDDYWLFRSNYNQVITYKDGTVSKPMDIDEIDSYGNGIHFYYERKGNPSDKNVTYDTYFEYTLRGESESHETAVKQYTFKGITGFEAMELNKVYSAKESKRITRYMFMPSESGEYIVDRNEAAFVQSYIWVKKYDGKSNLEKLSFDTDGSVYLEKGTAYLIEMDFGIPAPKNCTVAIYKKVKKLKGLEFVKTPDHPICLPGDRWVSLAGMQVKGIYTDGSTELISFGEQDSSGRRLRLQEIQWKNAEQARVLVSLGGYIASFDLKAGTLEQIPAVQDELSLNVVVGDLVPVKYTAAESGIHTIELTDGLIYDIVDQNGNVNILTERKSTAYFRMEKGQTYYFYVEAFITNPVVKISTGSHKHEFGQWTVTLKPSCTADGKRERVCQGCGYKETEAVRAAGHSFGNSWVVNKPATCGAAGERHQECTICKAWGKKEAIKPTGKHRLGAWRTTRGATALVTGIQERTCSVCGGAKQTRTIAKLKPTITLNVPQNKTLPMTLKKSFTVKVSGLAKGDSVKSWSSSNKKIVTVTSKGKLSAKKTGTVKITVTLRSGKTAWFKVKVQKSAVKTSKITGISKKVTLNKGKKYTLKPVLTPVTTLDKVKYSTSNKKVATVNSRGLIVAKGAGRATITVTAGSKKAKIVVTVPKVKTTKITGVKTSLTLKRGKSYRIRAKAYPTNTDEKITYTSSNKKIVTVTSKGVIKAVKKGKVTITVKSGRKSIKMQLTVK